MLTPLDRERRIAKKRAVTDAKLQAVGLDDRASAARRLEELEAERPGLPGKKRDIIRSRRPFLLQPADVCELRLRLLRLVLLVSEALDEAFEPRDVRLDTRHLFLCVQRARRLLEAPDVPRPGEEGRPAA